MPVDILLDMVRENGLEKMDISNNWGKIYQYKSESRDKYQAIILSYWLTSVETTVEELVILLAVNLLTFQLKEMSPKRLIQFEYFFSISQIYRDRQMIFLHVKNQLKLHVRKFQYLYE